jgi:hypothetical protein
MEQLPEGVLRRSAEQRLEMGLRGNGDQGTGDLPPAVAVVEPYAGTARRRAERRALLLFVHASECRELLLCLTLQDPACRAAMEWLGSLAVVAMDRPMAAMAIELSSRVPGTVGAELAQAAAPGPDVISALQREPQEELQALFGLLEPMGPYTSEPHPTVEENSPEQDRISNGFGTTVTCPLTGDDSFAGA